MKLDKIISLAAALCLLPMGTTFAQSDMLSEQMQSAMVNINSADLKQLINMALGTAEAMGSLATNFPSSLTM